MDAFFASVEQRDNAELRGKPVLVGGLGPRSVVCAASYEARVFGARSAMPMGLAVRKCPTAIVVPPRRSAYVEASEHVFHIFRDFTPLVEGLSLDEAFLDVTASGSLFGDGLSIAEAIRARIHSELSLTASAGVATNKFVAKLASDINKPDGVTVAPADLVPFLGKLPIGRMWGIGPKGEDRMKALGLHTFADLQNAEIAWLTRALGDEGLRYRELALGLDTRPVEPMRDAKSIGAEETYMRDLTTKEEVLRCALVHAEAVARRLTRAGLSARTVTLKVKHADFRLVTRRETLQEPVRDASSLYDCVRRMYAELALQAPWRIRLVGVSASGLEAEGQTRSLFPDPALAKRNALESLLMHAEQKTKTRIVRADVLEAPSREIDSVFRK
jgi:DNA polymerase IV